MASAGPNRKGHRADREATERESPHDGDESLEGAEPYDAGEEFEGDYPDGEGEAGSAAAEEGGEPSRSAEDGLEAEPSGSEPGADGVDIYGEEDYPPEEEAYPGEDDGLQPEGEHRSGIKEDTKVAPSRALALRRTEEDEDEESEESTRAGSQVRMEVVEGPDQGRVKRFRKVRMVIGRSATCDFRLADASVSRRHVELVRGEKGVLLRDLGSGNGTHVNGEQVSERFLEHEDEIALGNTRIRFHDEEAALQKLQAEVEEARNLRAASSEAPFDEEDDALPDAPEEPSHPGEEDVIEASIVPATPLGRVKKRLGFSGLTPLQKRAVVAGLVSGLLLVGSLFFLARPGRPLPPDPRQEAAGKRMDEARAAFKDGRYEEALQKIDTAERLVAGADRERLKDKVLLESAGRNAIRQAEAALGAGDFAAARAALAKVPENSEHRAKRDALLQEAATREADAVYRQVASAFETQNVEAAERALREVTPEIRAILGKRLTAFEGRLGELREEAERRAEAQRQAREEEVRQAQERELQTAFASVARRFHAGEYNRAVLETDRVVERYPDNPRVRERADELRRLIPTFEASFEDGQRKFQANALDQAVTPLRKARELLTQIGFPGALSSRLDQDLTAALVAAGQAALTREDWPKASESFRGALSLSDGEPGAREGVARLNREAEQAYLEGMRLWGREPVAARAKLRLAAEIADPGSATARKARQQLGGQEGTP